MTRVMGWLEEVLLFRSDRALSFLLVFLVLLLFVVYPFFSPEGIGKYLIDVGFTLVLISGTFAVENYCIRYAGRTLDGRASWPRFEPFAWDVVLRS